MAEIVLRELTKRYPNGFEAVQRLSLDIGEGELLVLVGPSGCGKTTALRMIAGLEDITSGDLYIGGRRVNDVPEKERDIAMVFQSYALYPHMTVAQNIGFSLRLAGVPKKEQRERVRKTAELLAIESLLDRRPKQLSGGQRQRVAMGRAIIREPQAFLMDEPLSNLDAKLRVQTRGEIESLQKRLGVTTVYVTHDQVEAMTMGDRIAVMLDGILQQVDTPTQVYDRPANLFVAGFIGSPQMNLAQTSVERLNDGLAVRLGDEVISIPAELAAERGLEPWAGKSLIVGIRPEDLQGNPQNGPAGAPRMKGRLERVEALGALLLGYFSVDAEAPKGRGVIAAVGDEVVVESPLVGTGTLFCATFEPRSAVRAGDSVEIAVDVERLHFFDPETEAALNADSSSPPAPKERDTAGVR
ncbi:MAG: ABC transporter ATP-binding protein [Gaiellaceae bacterium]